MACANKANPFSLRCELNEDTGWLTVFLCVRPAPVRLAVLAGELVHNLRSALDYVIYRLAIANNVAPTKRHQFPIFSSASAYAKRVGPDAKRPRNGGPLKGLVRGAYTVYESQPFKHSPEAWEDPLAMLVRLSNADKHRHVLEVHFVPDGTYDWGVTHNGTVDQGDRRKPTIPIDREAILGCIRFAHPLPTQREPYIDLRWQVAFGGRAIADERRFVFSAGEFRGIIDRTATTVDLFEIAFNGSSRLV